MRYRNDTGAPVTLATEPPCTVLPGWTVDTGTHVAGLTEVDDAGEPVTADPAGQAAVEQVGPDAPTPGTPSAEPPADTSAPPVPLADVVLEPPADWPAEPDDDTAAAGGPPAQLAAAPQPAGGVDDHTETAAGDVPAADQQQSPEVTT